MTTNMKAAFERAGYHGAREQWPSDDLLQVAINAMVNHANDTDATQHAIFRACRNDTALLRQLLLPWWRQATSSLIHEARRALRDRAQAGELNARQRRAHKVITLADERELAREKREREEAGAEQARLDEEYRTNYLQQWRETKARNFMINDMPFWQVSTRDANTWQRRTGHEVRFVELLLSGVPIDDRPIGHYRRPNEVDTLWEQSFSNG